MPRACAEAFQRSLRAREIRNERWASGSVSVSQCVAFVSHVITALPPLRYGFSVLHPRKRGSVALAGGGTLWAGGTFFSPLNFGEPSVCGGTGWHSVPAAVSVTKLRKPPIHAGSRASALRNGVPGRSLGMVRHPPRKAVRPSVRSPA